MVDQEIADRHIEKSGYKTRTHGADEGVVGNRQRAAMDNGAEYTGAVPDDQIVTTEIQASHGSSRIKGRVGHAEVTLGKRRAEPPAGDVQADRVDAENARRPVGRDRP